MAEYLKVWKTKEVTIGLEFVDGNVILERTRGYKRKKKRITLNYDKFPILVDSVFLATNDQPSSQLWNYQPFGMVDGGCGDILLEWGPYNHNKCNALLIRNGRGKCVAVEQENIPSFAFWLNQQITLVSELGERQDVS